MLVGVVWFVMYPPFALTLLLGVLLHVAGDSFHVVSEVGLALFAVAVGIAVVVGAFTLFHDWLTTTR